jgi:hypothetical protein
LSINCFSFSTRSGKRPGMEHAVFAWLPGLLLVERAYGGAPWTSPSVARIARSFGFRLALVGVAVTFALAPNAVHGQTTPDPASGQSSPPSGQTTQQPKPKAAPAPAADDNAFPEAQSQAAQKAAEASEKAASDGPASTAPGAAPDSSSRSRLKGLDLLGDNDSRISDGAGGIVQNPALAKEDLRVGQLYMGENNYAGAYSRFKEATLVNPGSTDAVFYLAEAARKSAHLDEAAKNYQLYLQADPKGKHGKDAKKALAQLAGK